MGDEDQGEDVDVAFIARPWSVSTVAGILFGAAANVARSFACLWDDLSVMCGQQAEIANDRADAYATLHRDLETLPSCDT